MRSQNKSYKKSSKGTEHQGLYDNIKRRKSFQSMVGQITQRNLNSGIKVKICSTMFLYSKERQFITAGSRLQETQSGHNKRQNAIASNWRSNQQT